MYRRALALWLFIGVTAAAAAAEPYRCHQRPGGVRVGACAVFAPMPSWSTARAALGIYRAEQFGASTQCATQAQLLASSWRLLGRVELPGLGNAAEYVDQHIDATAYDPALGAAVRAQYLHGRHVLLLGPTFFDLENYSDAERAASLLHEARHAASPGYRHVMCGANSSMAWRMLCDRRFSAEPDDPAAGAWSLEVVFLTLLREAEPCTGRARLAASVASRLADVFGRVSVAQRKTLRRWALAARKARRRQSPD